MSDKLDLMREVRLFITDACRNMQFPGPFDAEFDMEPNDEIDAPLAQAAAMTGIALALYSIREKLDDSDHN